LANPSKPLSGDEAVLFHPKRFAIASILYLRGEVSMAQLRRATGLTWGDLDYNLRILRERGLAETRRVPTSEGPRVLARLTPRGARAYERLVEYLRNHIERAGPD